MTIETTTQVPVRIAFDTLAPIAYQAVADLSKAAGRQVEQAGIDRGLRELLRMRVSQINGCAYCIDMHAKDARHAGEGDERLHGLIAWRDTSFFTERERVALAFVESVALMAQTHVPDEVLDAAAEHWSPAEVAALLALVVSITAWNQLGVTCHLWEPGSYEP